MLHKVIDDGSRLSGEDALDFTPRYDLSESEQGRYQRALVTVSRTSGRGDTIYTAWVRSSHPISNLVRTLEAKVFPEIPALMEPFEDESVFLTLIDTRPGTERVVHAFRLSSLAISGKGMGADASRRCTFGMALIDDLLSSGQGLDVDAFVGHYEGRGVDLTKCVSVETNFTVGNRVSTESGLRVSDLGYIAIFQLVKQLSGLEHNACVFAHLNEPAVASLGQIGVTNRPIAGRDDLKTPTIGETEFDEKYRPAEIPGSKENIEVFRALVPFAAPEIDVDVIDLVALEEEEARDAKASAPSTSPDETAPFAEPS